MKVKREKERQERQEVDVGNEFVLVLRVKS